ncbi:MAG: ECF-type sigma factor [Polyangiaceae bacterium]|nr:ECF-type sigma factor [Polyangiaceae bacterium]
MKRDVTPPSPPAAAPPGADAPAGEEVEALFGSSYEQLRALARARLGRGPRDALLDTTALVHESFERITRAAPQAHAADRGRFFRYAGHVMRSVIVDAVRARVAERRGGDAPHEPLDLSRLGDSFGGEAEILRVHEALDALARLDERLARVVEMRYFGGLSEAEIGEALGVTDRTVRRDWEKARLLLLELLA